jgi:hypothetical protein
MSEIYDTIGSGYRQFRRPDSRLAASILRGLADTSSVVNLGAGAGSYEPRDRRVFAVEPSMTMIRQRPRSSAPVVRASGTALPFYDEAVDQLTPVKQACLRHCRGPIRFLMGRWCLGRWGAFRMGVEHGAYCLGCCWALMTLLFFGGVMNLYWIAGLAVMVLLEKTIPAGDTLGKVTGGLLMLWGATFLYQAMA